ncbi:MAG TPA: ABC transporter permease [Chitinophagaceae bacterium]|nr:ABC transporter permease [Chitinophagaceae bacterium]
MLRLLKIEWLKLKNYRTFWILTVLYMISIVGINFIAFWIERRVFEEKQSKGVAELIIGNRPYSFPTVWHMTSFMSSFLLFLPGLLMIIFITNEYSYKTHRQNIIDGWSRNEFILVKILLALLLSILSTIVVILTALFFGFQLNSAFSMDKFEYIGYFFIQALTYSLASVLIAVFVKRGGLAIGFYFLYAVVLENALRPIMNRFLYNTGRFLPLQASDELIPLPIFENIQRQIVDPPNYATLFTAAGIYLILFLFLINRKFLKSDL